MCHAGWSGPFCRDVDCDPRCGMHGQCKNGTCLCVTGWNGKHCTIDGCPKQCSEHGSCVASAEAADGGGGDDLNFGRSGGGSEWRCECRDGWEGEDCSHRMEKSCGDGVDNDNGKTILP